MHCFTYQLVLVIGFLSVVVTSSISPSHALSAPFEGSIGFDYQAFLDEGCQKVDDKTEMSLAFRHDMTISAPQLAPADESISHPCVKRKLLNGYDDVGWIRYYCPSNEEENNKFYFEARYASQVDCLEEREGIVSISTHLFQCTSRHKRPGDDGPVAAIARCPSGTRAPPFTWPPSPAGNWVIEEECPDSQIVYRSKPPADKKCKTLYAGAFCCGQFVPRKAIRLGKCSYSKTHAGTFPSRVVNAPDQQSHLTFFFDGDGQRCENTESAQVQNILAVQSSTFEFHFNRHMACPSQQNVESEKLMETLKSPTFTENMLLITSTPCSEPFYSDSWFSAWRFSSAQILFDLEMHPAVSRIGHPEKKPSSFNSFDGDAEDDAQYVIKVWYEDQEDDGPELVSVTKCKEDGSFRVTADQMVDSRVQTFGRFLSRKPHILMPFLLLILVYICLPGLSCLGVGLLCRWVFRRIHFFTNNVSPLTRGGCKIDEGRVGTQNIEQLVLLETDLRFRAALR